LAEIRDRVTGFLLIVVAPLFQIPTEKLVFELGIPIPSWNEDFL